MLNVFDCLNRKKIEKIYILRQYGIVVVSNASDDALFTTIDWETSTRRRLWPTGRTLVLLAGAGGLTMSYIHDLIFAPDEPYPFSLVEWDVTRLDWLLLLAALVVVRYGLVPALATPKRTRKRLTVLLSRPAGLLSLAGLVALVVLAVLGPEQFGQTFPRLEERLQPPVFASTPVDLEYSYNCAGEVANGRCHGSWKYPLGTNRIGEDVVVMLGDGLRIALKLGFTAGVVMSVVGVVVGATAGYLGGRVDDLAMRYVDIQQTIPAVIVYIFLASLFLGDYGGVPSGGLFTFAIVFGLLDWGGIARLVRSEVLTMRSTGYVDAAKIAGASNAHVLRKHVIPNTTTTALTAVTRRIPLIVLAQVALAFLELSQVGDSLGLVLLRGITGDLAWQLKWWVTTSTVLTLVVLVVSFNVFGDVLRDVLDPQTEVE